ncbi:uncharacterized protein LOC116307688 [Actinia tenebrosa]|uniref:RBR-type E3 ubiquitin transferase n=1 Tax=Actinia tenebrosa TaxID=6105 RepID=A0A6P8J7Q9_ACTTE|nr:uncharacterized protein LOC116307688 [Actinia tenebrosa]
MVWNQRGKKGVHCGRTVRRNPAGNSSFGLNKQGVIVKYQKNAARFSDRQKESILEDRYGLIDGLPFGPTPRPNQFGNYVEFSLGKRKRWLLPELVQKRGGWDSENVFEDEGEEQELNVCFVERHIHTEFPRTRADCLSCYSDKDGKLLTPKKHKYSYLTDIRRLGENEKPSEVCYEICRPPPSTSWPNMSEDQFLYETYDMMGKSESKGQKSKGLLLGFYGVKDLSINKAKDFLSDMPKQRRAKAMESKVRTVPRKHFPNTVRGMNSEKVDRSTSFPMGQYIEGLLKGSKSAKEVGSEIFPCILSSTVRKYGKGCAMYIDSEPSTNPAEKSVKTVAYQDPTTLPEEPKLAITVNVAMQDLEVSKLRSDWADVYSEGGISPRKFTLDITSLLPRKYLNFSSIILFEVDEKVPRDGASAPTTVSLVPIALGSEKPVFAGVVQDFVSNIVQANMSAPTRIKEIVNTAVEVMTAASSDAKESLKQSCSRKTTVRRLGFLNKVCGWESEAFTLDTAKQKLKDEFQKVSLECNSEDDVLDSQWMMLSMDCGICFETFEGDDTMLTSLTECGHAFCSDCWKGHLKTQITQGIPCIRCPGQGCSSKVDDTIIMAIVPAWYNKFLNMKFNKELETSPNWKWCPENGCKKVIKAKAPKLDAMTVLCDCGTAWCFKCQQPSHWPATCKESEVFDKKGEDYREIVLQDTKELITSVMVKNCPQCDYPIEKHFGCQFMLCILCQTHFCWNCSTPATYGHSCNKDETDDLTKVELSYKSKQYQILKLMNVVVKSIQARAPKQLSAKVTKAKALETGVTSYKTFSSKIPKEALTDSSVSRHMENIVENGISETVREAVDLEFQAHLVLEGFAKKAGVSRAQCKSGLQTMSQLAFVADRIEYLCQEPFLLYKDGRIQRLEKLLAIGKDCILTLKKCCTIKKK